MFLRDNKDSQLGVLSCQWLLKQSVCIRVANTEILHHRFHGICVSFLKIVFRTIIPPCSPSLQSITLSLLIFTKKKANYMYKPSKIGEPRAKNCSKGRSFSSPEPLGLICNYNRSLVSRPLDQETTGSGSSGDENEERFINST